MRSRFTLWIALVLVGVVFPTVGLAGNGWTQRPLTDFLDEQGSSSTFFAPVPDYLGWVDGDFVTFALVDYAGLAEAWIEATSDYSLPTDIDGHVKEREIDTDTFEVKIKLRTANALSFAQSVADIVANGFDFAGTDTIFGNKAADVADGDTAATGWAHLDITLTTSSPDADLPDLVGIFDTVDYAPASFEFKSQCVGLRPDGTRARLRIHQVASTVWDGDAWEWVFTTEIVSLENLGN